MAQILIIEDDPTVAMVLKQILLDEGHSLDMAADGLEGLSLLRQEPVPDLVLMDLFMPRMNGRTVLEGMRAEPRLSRVPVVLVTGAVSTPEDFPSSGSYQGTLTKPFGVEQLLDAVQACLEVQQ